MLTCEQISIKGCGRAIGFSLVPGALLAIFGSNADELIAVLAGRLKPDAGRVLFDDKPIQRNRDFHSLALYLAGVSFRPWENVERAVKRLAKAGGGAPELAEAAIRYFGLTNHRAKKCRSLPASLQKRVMLTQLLTHPRPIWLLDHPESDLDAEGLQMLDAVMANRCNQDGIVVIATERRGFMTPLPSLELSDFPE